MAVLLFDDNKHVQIRTHTEHQVEHHLLKRRKTEKSMQKTIKVHQNINSYNRLAPKRPEGLQK